MQLYSVIHFVNDVLNPASMGGKGNPRYNSGVNLKIYRDVDKDPDTVVLEATGGGRVEVPWAQVKSAKCVRVEPTATKAKDK